MKEFTKQQVKDIIVWSRIKDCEHCISVGVTDIAKRL